jgi:catechol 2,3-dioxygenase-like lactoylglutathione lyase family enzyme
MSIFNHICAGSNDLEKSQAFYDAALGALGIKNFGLIPDRAVMYGAEAPTFMVVIPIDGESACHSNGGTIAFVASSRAAVEAFHQQGQEHGGSDEGAPGHREEGPPGNYVAYLRDPYGNKICAVTYASE